MGKTAGQEDPRSLTVTTDRDWIGKEVARSGTLKRKVKDQDETENSRLRKIKEEERKYVGESLVGATAFQKVTKACKRYTKKCNRRSVPDCTRGIDQAGTKVGDSDQQERNGEACNQKRSYSRDNRVILCASPHQPQRLPPRC